MKFFSSILIAFVVISSCQKKVDWRVDPDTGDILDNNVVTIIDTTPLLSKMVASTSNEIMTTLFFYDSKQLLKKEKLTGSANGSAVDVTKVYSRDTLDRITEIVITNNSGGATEIHKTTVFYDDDSRDFLWAVGTRNIGGLVVADSLVFTYDGNGHVAIIKNYQRPVTVTGKAELKARQEFAYADNNLVLIKDYRDTANGSDLVLTETKRLAYDKRINPLQLKMDAFLTGRIESVSQNNLVNMEMAGSNTTAINSMVQSSFTYSSSKKPLAALTTMLPAGTITQVFFYY